MQGGVTKVSLFKMDRDVHPFLSNVLEGLSLKRGFKLISF